MDNSWTCFQHYYECGHCLSVDEMCIFFKGRHCCRCYNPQKPHKWHLKAFCLNDADTGYLSNFFMYRGKDEQRPAGVSASEYPVRRLTEPTKYHGKGHVLCTDNWYTSVGLAKFVYDAPRCMHFVGTVKVNRKGLDPHCIFKEAGPNKKARGTMKCSVQALTPDRQHNLYQTAWMDGKPVHLLSTFPTRWSMVKRGKAAADGTYSKVDIPRPTVIGAYNQGMGGTDLVDQLSTYYDDRMRTYKWQIRIYNHFLRISAINAHVLYYKSQGAKTTLLSFITAVATEWCGVASVETPNSPPAEESLVSPGPTYFSKAAWVAHRERRCTGKHTPLAVSTAKECDQRGYCKVCNAKACFKCRQCNVYLHIGGADERGCWERFHGDFEF
jgi:hypothetical protein